MRGFGKAIVLLLVASVAAAIIAAVLASVGLYGDDVEGASRLGVTRAEDGGVQISYLGCGDEALISARVQVATTDGAAGAVVWSVEAEDPSMGRHDLHVDGDAPRGYVLQVDEVGRLLEGGAFHAVVETSQVGSVPLTFDVAEVEEGAFLLQFGRVVDEASFGDSDDQNCE